MQSGLGAFAFRRSNPEAFRHSTLVIWPCIAGGVVGAMIATTASEHHMEMAIAGLMGFMLVVLLVNPNRWIRESAPDATRNRSWASMLIFFGIGVYGGFIQAGIGIFLLAGLVLSAHYSLKDANAIKLAIVSLICIPALLIFAFQGQINYTLGLLMATFQMLGAVIGVWLAKRVPNINVWIHRLLIIMVAASAIKLFGWV